MRIVYAGTRVAPVHYSGLLDGILAADEADEDHDNRDYQEDVDEAAHGVRSHKTEKPEDEKDDCNGGKHRFLGYG
jgi:hypothetical protein